MESARYPRKGFLILWAPIKRSNLPWPVAGPPPEQSAFPGALMQLTGRVESGKGDASRWLSTFNDEYSRKVGMPVFPGSLNVRLDHSFDGDAPELRLSVLQFGREEYGGERDILLLPCRLASLGGQPAFLWSTTTAARERPDKRLVEIVAPVGLRATYGLSDGDLLTVELLVR